MKCDMIKKTLNSRSNTCIFDGMSIIAYVLKVSTQELLLKTVTNYMYVKCMKKMKQCIVVFGKCNIE